MTPSIEIASDLLHDILPVSPYLCITHTHIDARRMITNFSCGCSNLKEAWLDVYKTYTLWKKFYIALPASRKGFVEISRIRYLDPYASTAKYTLDPF